MTSVQSITGVQPKVVSADVVDDAVAAPSGSVGPSLAVPRAMRLVAGVDNVGLALALPRATGPVELAALADEPTLQEREQTIYSLTETIVSGQFSGLDTTEAQNALTAALWSTPDFQKHALALWIASTKITTPEGRSLYLDEALDTSLDDAAWRSFSFFMYQYTAGFGDTTIPPVVVGGIYDAPPWWYVSRPYQNYEPYWQYRLPSTWPYRDLPIVIIEIPGRGRYNGPRRGHDYRLPQHNGDRFPHPPRRQDPNRGPSRNDPRHDPKGPGRPDRDHKPGPDGHDRRPRTPPTTPAPRRDPPANPIPRRTEPPRVPQTPRVPRNDQPRVPQTPHVPRNDQPRVPQTPRVPRNDQPRIPQTPRVPRNDQPRIPQTPRAPRNDQPRIPRSPGGGGRSPGGGGGQHGGGHRGH